MENLEQTLLSDLPSNFIAAALAILFIKLLSLFWQRVIRLYRGRGVDFIRRTGELFAYLLFLAFCIGYPVFLAIRGNLWPLLVYFPAGGTIGILLALWDNKARKTAMFLGNTGDLGAFIVFLGVIMVLVMAVLHPLHLDARPWWQVVVPGVVLAIPFSRALTWVWDRWMEKARSRRRLVVLAIAITASLILIVQGAVPS